MYGIPFADRRKHFSGTNDYMIVENKVVVEALNVQSRMYIPKQRIRFRPKIRLGELSLKKRINSLIDRAFYKNTQIVDDQPGVFFFLFFSFYGCISGKIEGADIQALAENIVVFLRKRTGLKSDTLAPEQNDKNEKSKISQVRPILM